MGRRATAMNDSIGAYVVFNTLEERVMAVLVTISQGATIHGRTKEDSVNLVVVLKVRARCWLMCIDLITFVSTHQVVS